jgi:hypothetical protein
MVAPYAGTKPIPVERAGTAHTKGNMNRVVADQSLVANLHSQGIEKDQRIGRF